MYQRHFVQPVENNDPLYDSFKQKLDNKWMPEPGTLFKLLLNSISLTDNYCKDKLTKYFKLFKDFNYMYSVEEAIAVQESLEKKDFLKFKLTKKNFLSLSWTSTELDLFNDNLKEVFDADLFTLVLNTDNKERALNRLLVVNEKKIKPNNVTLEWLKKNNYNQILDLYQ